MEFIRKNTKLLFILVLPVYFYIVQSSILNRHSHFLPNGMVITHSHPLDKNSEGADNNHHHNKTEICFFSNIHFDYYSVSPEIQLEIYDVPVTLGFHNDGEKKIESHILLHKQLRAPPVFQLA